MSEPTMTSRVATLSAKEKETLRLLAHGHDAKSLARHLGLSIHTVNERLRDARRKLAVSSSREAARQLREAEGDTPDSLGDKALGDAPPATAVGTGPRQTDSAGPSRRRAWLIGGTAMTIALAFLALAAFPGDAPQGTPAPAQAVDTTQAAATDAARRWLALLDASDWEGSWRATNGTFRSAVDPKAWKVAAQGVRAWRGSVRSRALTSADLTGTAPESRWILKFQSDFAGGTAAVETVWLEREKGQWRAVGYTID